MTFRIPTSSSKNTEQKNKAKTQDAVQKETYRDPSEGLSLSEVYERLMQKLDELISSNEYKGKFTSSQSGERLSQQAESKKELSQEQSEKKKVESARISEPKNYIDDEWSNWSFAEEADGDSNLPEYSKKQKLGDDSYFEFPEVRPPADDERPDEVNNDRAEMEIIQADPEYGVSYVVRFFWKILRRVLSKESGLHAEVFWGDTLRLFYKLIMLGGEFSM